MTPDIDRLKANLGDLGDIVGYLELELVDDPRWAEPSDTSYLNDADRQNADIMANVEAMSATNELISWFGRDMEGFVGLWRGPKNTPLADAPVVRLDTEGQYDIVARTIGDYLAISLDHDEFDETRATLVNAGFTVRESPDAIWESIESGDAANDHRHALYNEGRKKRGLPPIGGA